MKGPAAEGGPTLGEVPDAPSRARGLRLPPSHPIFGRVVGAGPPPLRHVPWRLSLSPLSLSSLSLSLSLSISLSLSHTHTHTRPPPSLSLSHSLSSLSSCLLLPPPTRYKVSVQLPLLPHLSLLSDYLALYRIFPRSLAHSLPACLPACLPCRPGPRQERPDRAGPGHTKDGAITLKTEQSDGAITLKTEQSDSEDGAIRNEMVHRCFRFRRPSESWAGPGYSAPPAPLWRRGASRHAAPLGAAPPCRAPPAPRRRLSCHADPESAPRAGVDSESAPCANADSESAPRAGACRPRRLSRREAR